MNLESQLIFERYFDSLREAYGSGAMSPDQLKDYLMKIKGATPVTVEVEAEARMKKTGNPYLGTMKHSVINGIAGGDYELGIQNRELNAHEGDPNYVPTFKAESIWKGKGRRIAPVVIQHVDSGECYLAIGTPRAGSATYTFQGKPIDAATIDPWIIKPGVATKQLNVGIAQEDTNQPRYPLLKNIRRIKIAGFDITVTQ